MLNNILAEINIKTLSLVVIIVAVIAVLFSVLILIVYRYTAISDDEKTEKIKDLLANANCGGCGFAGCAEFAKALSEGKADISSCGPTQKENKNEIAKILGIELKDEEEKRAVIHCNGGMNCFNKFEYVGNAGCSANASFVGGNKACSEGCIGEGDCFKACDYNAIRIVDQVARVIGDECIACGKCVTVCPKNLAELIPKSAKIYIACSSLCRGKDVMTKCQNGCIGCGICVKSCPEGAISMKENLPVIDYKKCTGCKTCVAKCPRKCIKEL